MGGAGGEADASYRPGLEHSKPSLLEPLLLQRLQARLITPTPSGPSTSEPPALIGPFLPRPGPAQDLPNFLLSRGLSSLRARPPLPSLGPRPPLLPRPREAFFPLWRFVLGAPSSSLAPTMKSSSLLPPDEVLQRSAGKVRLHRVAIAEDRKAQKELRKERMCVCVCVCVGPCLCG